jgi:hypothetical protein
MYLPRKTWTQRQTKLVCNAVVASSIASIVVVLWIFKLAFAIFKNANIFAYKSKLSIQQCFSSLDAIFLDVCNYNKEIEQCKQKQYLDIEQRRYIMFQTGQDNSQL